jgi:hypothetical protein
MGSLQQPFQPGTVLHFGSLEFMSLDGSYDMILLPPTRDSDNGGRQPTRRQRNRRRLPHVAEEQHSGLSRRLPADGGRGGATKAKQEAAPRRLSSESTASAPQRGTRRASTSRLRRRRVPFPRNTPTPSGRTTPARSQRTCWASPSYLRLRCSLPRRPIGTYRFPSRAFWIQPRPTKRLRFDGSLHRGLSKPSGVQCAVTLGPADGRLDLRALGFRGR